ncbi:replicative DNA helicase [Priestia megaterium]|uniref:replicative DNA helicase n=1 Tax=Priestia megaterium TaxID=1404 RepID=UPI001F12C578|nr:replicative DNA helicase [Priestia megaterium]UMZ35575.1 replicative DNA helicase [Priestia megaterium]
MEYQLGVENIEAEQAVLGSIFLESDLLDESILQTQQFSRASHRAIFKAMREVQEANKQVDIVTVVTQLGDAIEQVGGVSYLSDLANAVPTTANFKTYEQMILESYGVREARKLGAKLATVTSEEEVPSILQSLGELQDIKRKKNRTKTDVLADIFSDMSTPTQGLTGIDTGLDDLNRMTGGWQGGDLIIVAARPSMGKTAFALSLAQSNCEKGGVSDIFSLEMSDTQLVKRMLSGLGRVNGKKWSNPFEEFTNEDHENMASTIGHYEKWDINIHDEPTQTVYDIRSKIKDSFKEHPDKKHLVIIDYLQLISSVGKFERKDLEIGHISGMLKKIAREFNVSVIALSQLSRGVEQRQDKRPMMSDIRESGSIEQDADVISFLYRDDYYNKDSENPGITEIILGKQRNGPVGTVQTLFRKEYGQFLNLSRQLEAKMEAELIG